MTRYVSAILVAVCLLIVGMLWLRGADDDLEEAARRLRLRVEREPAVAWAEARQLLLRYPEDELAFGTALFCGAKAASNDEWRVFVKDHQSRIGALSVAEESVLGRLLQDGQLLTAEAMLSSVLETSPDNPFALQAMGDLLLREGRQESARPFLRRLLQQNAISVEQLIFLCSRREVLEDRQSLEKAQRQEPGGRALTGLAAIAFSEGDFVQAARLFREATELLPNDRAAWAGLGMSLYRGGNPDNQLLAWRTEVESRGITHGDVSFLLGRLDEQRAEVAAAVQHFQAALQQAAWHRPAAQALGSLLSRQAETRAAGVVLVGRAAKIHDLELLMHAMLFGQRQADDFARAARLCSELGDAEVALAWLSGATAFAQDAQSLPSRNDLIRVAEVAAAEFHAARDFAPAEVAGTVAAVPNRLPGESAVGDSAAGSSVAGQGLQFVDRGAEVGLTTAYHGGITDFDNGLWIYQGFGGGVAVLDIDGDDAADLYFTQACRWPAPNTLPWPQQDLVYRNRQTGFEQVNDRAVPPESGFGQGVAVGDFNRDGFDDLYVANIGANRLLISNGDGTFLEFPLPDQDAWTSSCLMADMNGDGFDDLFDVCYLQGREPFERVCQTGDDKTTTRSCLPSLFEPAADRLLLSQGQGRLVDVSQQCGVASARGRGLGIVAAEMDGEPGLELFISNDLSANHYWQIRTTDSGLQLVEAAEVHGLARNGEGQLEACMGIAAGDFSRNGHLDFVVTNFLNETNTFYESLGSGFYRDRSEASQLGRHSRSQLGFGTQPLDADLDGDLDVVVTNGHVDDYTHLGAGFRMKPDVFENLGGSVFAKCPASAAGAYGNQPVLGRALARVDWNRDGRDDLVVTHLDRPPALLENQSVAQGQFVSLKLIGVASNRPAIGAIVRIKSGEGEIVLQQTAGDGYYCSNERRLQFGGFREGPIPELTVHWSSGHVSRLSDVATGQRLVLVEGRDALYQLKP